MNVVITRQDGKSCLTVGIYAHNEQANISHVLESVLKRQELPDTTRVIVVCSGCTDLTVPTVQHFAADDKRIELVIERERLGVGSAINRILERCATDLLILIEADTRPYKGTVHQLVAELEENNAGLVGAWPIVENENNGLIPRGLAFIRRVVLRSLFDLRSFDDRTYSNSEFVCIRRRLLDPVPTQIVNVDTYIDLCIHKRGYPVLPSRKVKVLIRLPESIPDFLAQRRRIYYGHMQIKRLFGTYASSMEGIVSRKPPLAVRSVVQEVRINPRLTFEMWPVLLLDLLAYAGACLDLVRRSDHVRWKMISTAKWRPTSCRCSP